MISINIISDKNSNVCKAFADLIESKKHKVFIFVGTNRHTWDSLGPMTGSLILEFYEQEGENYSIYGSLDEPLNLHVVNKKYKEIVEKHGKDSIYIVVDAALARNDNYHKCIAIRKGGLVPGKGFGADGESIGDYSIYYFIKKDDLSNKDISNPFKAAKELKYIFEMII